MMRCEKAGRKMEWGHIWMKEWNGRAEGIIAGDVDFACLQNWTTVINERKSGESRRLGKGRGWGREEGAKGKR